MAELRPPITAAELREWLVDADLPLDDAMVATLLPKLQPMRGTLRSAGLKRLSAMLRGEALASGWVDPRPPERGSAPARPGSLYGEIVDVAPPRLFRRDNVGKRALIGYAALVMGTFGLMSLISPGWVVPAFFFGMAAFCFFVSVTGWGLGGREGAEEGPAVRIAASAFICLFGAFFVWWGARGFMRSLAIGGDMRNDFKVEAVLVAFGGACIALGLTRARRRRV